MCLLTVRLLLGILSCLKDLMRHVGTSLRGGIAVYYWWREVERAAYVLRQVKRFIPYHMGEDVQTARATYELLPLPCAQVWREGKRAEWKGYDPRFITAINMIKDGVFGDKEYFQVQHPLQLLECFMNP